MTKIYLTDCERQVIILRDLMSIDINCGLLSMGYIMPAVSDKEKEAVQCIKKYCKKNIAEQLKNCELFAELTKKEYDEEIKSYNISITMKATLGELLRIC